MTIRAVPVAARAVPANLMGTAAGFALGVAIRPLAPGVGVWLTWTLIAVGGGTCAGLATRAPSCLGRRHSTHLGSLTTLVTMGGAAALSLAPSHLAVPAPWALVLVALTAPLLGVAWTIRGRDDSSRR